MTAFDWPRVLARAPEGLTVSAIVVSYHTGAVLMDCLHALEADPDISEIVVVDNGNPPAMLALVRELAARSGKLKIVGTGLNVGFAAGVNTGAKSATGQRLLVINPDALLRRGSVAALEAGRVGGVEPMVVGGRIFGLDGAEQRGGRRRQLNYRTAAGTFLGLSKLGLPGLNRNEEPAPSGPVAMGAVSGALMYLSREGFEALGGFDAGYFLHVEDLDLCRRAQALGGSVIYTPLAGALHFGATSAAPRMAVEQHKAAGLERYFTKFAETRGERVLARLMAPVMTAALVVRAWVGR